MEIRYHPRFARDLRRIRDPALGRRVEQMIEEWKEATRLGRRLPRISSPTTMCETTGCH